MNQMIEVKTAELTGPALDWAVCLAANGFSCQVTSDYSTDWAQGGPLIEEYAVQLEPCAGYWVAKTDCRLGSNHYAKRDGESPLIAACRAIVAAKLGAVVSVPAELAGGTK